MSAAVEAPRLVFIGARPNNGGSLLSVYAPGLTCPACGHQARLVVQRPGSTTCVPCADKAPTTPAAPSPRSTP